MKGINPIRKINWFLMKKFHFGIKRNYPFRTSATFVKKHFKGKPIICIEIGTHRGESAEFLLKINPNIEKLYCIDPYEKEFIIDGKPASIHFRKAKKRLSKFNVRFILETSDDAVKHFKKNSIDYVYIDGLHTYEQVKKDIENYFPILKKGGIMAGNDIGKPRIAKVLFEFCNKKKQEPIIKEMDWMFIKK